eukprot:Trichotokara_eunicae@DN4626_c0_g1_i1.p1
MNLHVNGAGSAKGLKEVTVQGRRGEGTAGNNWMLQCTGTWNGNNEIILQHKDTKGTLFAASSSRPSVYGEVKVQFGDVKGKEYEWLVTEIVGIHVNDDDDEESHDEL